MCSFEFKKLDMDFLDAYQYFALKTSIRVSDWTLGMIFMWSCTDDIRYVIIDNLICISEFNKSKPYNLTILGDLTCKKNVRTLKKIFQINLQNGWQYEISNLEEYLIPVFESISNKKLIITFDRNQSDYIYNTSDLVKMEGVGYRRLRKSINRFKRKHPNVIYKRYESWMYKYCFTLMKQWNEQKGIEGDCANILHLLSMYEQLGLLCGTFWINGNMEAIFIGEIYKDMAFIHAGKTNRKFEGLYVFGVREFVKREFLGTKYINRGDDMGDRNIKMSKLLYRPVMILNKYKIQNYKEMNYGSNRDGKKVLSGL